MGEVGGAETLPVRPKRSRSYVGWARPFCLEGKVRPPARIIHSLMRLHRINSFMLLQPAVKLSGLSVSLQKVPSNFGGAKGGPDNEAVGGP
jgi:hypothetical protein